LTDRPEFINRKYPVLVLIPGEDYKNGDSMLYPPHLLAHKEVLVVTFNYRLGALGVYDMKLVYCRHCWYYCSTWWLFDLIEL